MARSVGGWSAGSEGVATVEMEVLFWPESGHVRSTYVRWTIELTREALRRCDWLRAGAPPWHGVNGLYLSPEAPRAFAGLLKQVY